MYDAFSKSYDRFVNWDSRLKIELPFIDETLRRHGVSSVLDSACGTGMHAIALGKLGYNTAGADLSAGMIAQARANARAHCLDIPFHLAGFGELVNSFGEARFDALLCLGNSLPHLLTPQALHAALADFYTCLKAGGLLLVQNRNFDALLAHKDRWMEPQSHADEEGEWLFLRFYDYEPNGLITFNIMTLHKKDSGQWSQQVTTTRLWPLRQTQLEDALGAAGFRAIQQLGDMQRTPYDPAQSGNLVIVAQKPLV